MIKLLIGRSAECDICYDSVYEISSKHAEIVVGDDGRIIFTDYSTNGSYVNGQAVHHTSVMVSYGAVIMFPGNVVLDWNIVASKMNPEPVMPSYASSEADMPVSTPQGGTLSFSQTITDGFTSGFRNCLSLIGAVILYILTIWIPYINVGTTIALLSLPLFYAQGKAFNPLYIFDSQYRRDIGNFLLLAIFRMSVISVSAIFMFIPSIVMTITYMLSNLFLIDQGKDPIAAMQMSSRTTYGSKWTIFAVMLVYLLILSTIIGIFAGLTAASASVGVGLVVVLGFITFIAVIVMSSVSIGILGSVWNQLKDKSNY
jgi:pSer/pThr/pTyr-binding forkhead associated (FHA) protein